MGVTPRGMEAAMVVDMAVAQEEAAMVVDMALEESIVDMAVAQEEAAMVVDMALEEPVDIVAIMQTRQLYRLLLISLVVSRVVVDNFKISIIFHSKCGLKRAF